MAFINANAKVLSNINRIASDRFFKQKIFAKMVKNTKQT